MLSPAELLLVAEELRAACAGARLQKIGQPDDDRVVLRLYRDGEERSILLVAGRPYPRAHLATLPLKNPRTPPPFCEALRAELLPGRLVDVAAAPGDRVLVLTFDVKTAADVERRALHAELFGARPNLVLTDGRGVILAALRASTDGPRPTAPGLAYVAPTPPEDPPATRTPWASFGDDFRPEGLEGGALSRALEAWFAPREAAARLAAAKEELADELGRLRRKTRKLLEKQREDVRAADDAPRLRAEGEVLKAHLGSVPAGAKEATLEDWSSGVARPVRLVLDPSLSARANAEARFEEAKRLERGRDAATIRLGATEERLAALDAADLRLAAAEDKESVDALTAELRKAGLVPPPAPPPEATAPGARKTEAARKCYRTFLSADGLEILVGRTADDNDELSFRVANGDDFWLHVRDYPGSHVVVRARDELPQETLLDAATLAVKYSRAEFAGSRDVSWTRRKWIHKTRGAPAGQVTLSQHKTVRLRCDPDRLKRILDRAKP